MKPLILLLAAVLMYDSTEAQKKLVIIGSSTSACFKVDPVTECYVAKLNSYFNRLPPNDTLADNQLALAGSNVLNGMPGSFISPYAAAVFQPLPLNNISFALTLKPDVILVNYPTNSYDVLPADSILYCLRTIRDSANKKGIPCYVTTTQPRTSPGNYNTPQMKKKLALLKDSIMAEFGNFAIDFWTGLVNPADSSLLYDSGDHIHMNGDGHSILGQRVEAKNIFATAAGAVLPVTFLQFNAVCKNNTDELSWATTQETDVSLFEIQRSADGAAFLKIGIVPPGNNIGKNEYQFIDEHPLNELNYYKIVVYDRDNKRHASPIIRITNNNYRLNVPRAFVASTTQLAVEIQNNETQTAQIQVYNTMGTVLCQVSKTLGTGNNLVYVNTPLLPNGVYYIRVNKAGQSVVCSLLKNQ